MRIWKTLAKCAVFFAAATACALEPEEILVIANSDIAASVRIAEYYCTKREVPKDNLLILSLGKDLSDTISRDDYEHKLALPVRRKLTALGLDKNIRCLLTIYGVPIKTGGRGQLQGQEAKLKILKKLEQEKKKEIAELKKVNSDGLDKLRKRSQRNLARLQSQIGRILGKETGASVDSELSMVLFEGYDLYQWQPNRLKNSQFDWSFKTLMVCRLDGPGEKIATSLIDKALKAEKTGLDGIACIDSRGISDSDRRYSFGFFDQSMRDLAAITKARTGLKVKDEPTEKLFAPGSCPRTAIYCGWYSLKKYVDAFDFVDGAIGYHIASLEAVDLRDPHSSQWCAAMLSDGITATLGAVAEPYLHSFPVPKEFFLELFNGRCLVEAYYHTKPFNSWQLVLIGDPLYTPFKKSTSDSSVDGNVATK